MKTIVLTALAVLFVCTNLSAQFTGGYAECYSDSSALSYITDAATDKAGNTYIVGYKTNLGDQYYQTHLFLRKLSPGGVQEWIEYFNPAQDSIDNAKAVAVDDNGNIYVTGTRIDTFCNICTYRSKISDVITMKYNARGRRIWLNRYKPGDYILGTASDIYVTPNGYSVVAANEVAYNAATFVWENTGIVIAITPAGNTAWVKRLDKTIVNSATADTRGNLLVAAAWNPDNLYQTAKPYAVKLSRNGSTLWSYTFNEFNKNGQLYRIFTDNANNVYANGQTDTISFFNVKRILTIKLNGATGGLLWSAKEEPATWTLPYIYGNYTVDAAGNSYVAGSLNLNGYFRDIVVSKYNSSGTRMWSNTFNDALNGDDIATDIATDKNGLVYVTGSAYGPAANRYSMPLFVYNANGSLYYQNFYQRNFYQVASGGLELDSAGNVFVSGGCTVRYTPASFASATNVNASHVNSIKQSLRIYPNPVADVLTVQLSSSASKIQYSITDMLGTVVAKGFAASGSTVTVPVKNLKAGSYMILINDGRTIIKQKFIKQ